MTEDGAKMTENGANSNQNGAKSKENGAKFDDFPMNMKLIVKIARK
jgi:hypothetical protein